MDLAYLIFTGAGVRIVHGTTITLLNDIRAMYETHRALVGGGPVHGSIDNNKVYTKP